MYSEQSIAVLTKRIGWDTALPVNLSIAIDQDNSTASSGRKVNTFHQLATVENMYWAVPEVNMDQLKFNTFLSSIREQSVREVLTEILDQHHLYDQNIDYSNTILENSKLFDDAIGYTIAVKCLELFVTSTRSNATERSNAMSFNTLKIELEGAKNDNGHFIAKGIVYKKESAIKKTQRILFPDPVVIIGDNTW
jgi:hypothetical protein